MSESINVENKKQNHLKPPLSVGRIAGEILAGTATGLAVVLLVSVTYFVYLGYILGHKRDYVVVELIALFDIVCPPLYGLVSAVGVYLVGKIGKQTGSFLLTLIGGFLGGLIAHLSVLPALFLSSDVKLEVELWALMILILLIPPIFATIGFNLRRRYKQPPSS